MASNNCFEVDLVRQLVNKREVDSGLVQKRIDVNELIRAVHMLTSRAETDGRNAGLSVVGTVRTPGPFDE